MKKGSKKGTTSNRLKAAPPPSERRKAPRRPYQSPLGLDVQILEQTFKVLQPRLAEVVGSFYARLFGRYPRIRSRFAGVSQAEQETKMLAALEVLMRNLRKPESLVNTLLSLGDRHRGYGASPEHYAAFASVLLEVFKEYTGAVWTAKVHDAWSTALETMAAAMLKAYETPEVTVMAAGGWPPAQDSRAGAGAVEDIAILQDIVEHAAVNVMIADADLDVVFVNKRAREAFAELESELAAYIPGFTAGAIVGGGIHRYHKDPRAVESLLAGLRPGETRKGEITPGRLVFEYETRGLYGSSGTLKGYVVYWRDVTDER